MQNAGKTKQLMPAAMATLKHGSDCGNVLTEIWVWERSFPLLAENLAEGRRLKRGPAHMCAT